MKSEMKILKKEEKYFLTSSTEIAAIILFKEKIILFPCSFRTTTSDSRAFNIYDFVELITLCSGSFFFADGWAKTQWFFNKTLLFKVFNKFLISICCGKLWIKKLWNFPGSFLNGFLIILKLLVSNLIFIVLHSSSTR